MKAMCTADFAQEVQDDILDLKISGKIIFGPNEATAQRY